MTGRSAANRHGLTDREFYLRSMHMELEQRFLTAVGRWEKPLWTKLLGVCGAAKELYQCRGYTVEQTYSALSATGLIPEEGKAYFRDNP